jgi:hypothetical protein
MPIDTDELAQGRETMTKLEATSREESKSKKSYVDIVPALQPENGDLLENEREQG